MEMFEKCVQDLSKAVEESQKNVDSILEELRDKQKQEIKMPEGVVDLKEFLRSEKQKLQVNVTDLGYHIKKKVMIFKLCCRRKGAQK